MRPTPSTRETVYTRDGNRCVACHTPDTLTFQHRRAVGMGGTKNPPHPTDGLVLCATCNTAAESNMQTLALAFGWKVRRWANPTRVPVYYPHEFAWYRLDGDTRIPVGGVEAIDMMHAVYGDQWFTWRQESS